MGRKKRTTARRRAGRKGSAQVVRRALIAGLLAALLTQVWPLLRFGYVSVRFFFQSPPQHLLLPVKGVVASSMVDTWGAPRSGGRLHKGIDIFAPRGTPVVSTTDGVVVRRGSSRLGGNFVTIMGPGSYYHYYAHLQQPTGLRLWTRVKAGTVVGFVGNTGNARTTPPHLHYGLYTMAGRPLNPYPLLTTRLEGVSEVRELGQTEGDFIHKKTANMLNDRLITEFS